MRITANQVTFSRLILMPFLPFPDVTTSTRARPPPPCTSALRASSLAAVTTLVWLWIPLALGLRAILRAEVK